MKAEIWTKPNCPYCVKAKNLFNIKGVEYNEVLLGIEDSTILESNQRSATREELLERVPNAKTVPQIWLDNNYIGGYTELASFWNIN
jgi:glutaredoxin